MTLVAYRSEYQIRVSQIRNRIVYERFEELTLAANLPYYLSDWQRATTHLQPGFTVLNDLRRTLGANVPLLLTFLRSHELLLDAGIGMAAEVHPLAPTLLQVSRLVRAQSKLPAKLFTSRPDAEAFLEEYRLALEPK